jgi:vacuolar-type H+-ATPase subunit H
MTDLPGYDDFRYDADEAGVAPRGRRARQDVMAYFDDLIQIVASAKSMPLSSSVLLSREEMIALLEEARALLPDELLEARQLLRDRDELLDIAQRKARGLVDDAQAEAARMVESTQIVREANFRADQIVTDAQTRARNIIHEAEYFIDNKLGQFEVAMTKLVRQTQQIRQRFTEQMAPTSLVGADPSATLESDYGVDVVSHDGGEEYGESAPMGVFDQDEF